jgi:hypothetical protein
MATIPNDEQFVGTSASVVLKEKKSTFLNNQSAVYTYADFKTGSQIATATTGGEVSFTEKEIYNTSASAGTGNITNDLTGAQLGIVQKIYHQEGSAPSFPAGWVLLGSGTYSTTALNVIYAEWCGGTRVEYWIVQPA